MALKEITKREYEGKINIESENEYVLLTIPYNKGWRITVDGKETNIIELQNVFMGIKLEKGEHIIRMKFIPRGYMVGGAISTVGIIVFVLSILRMKNGNKLSKSVTAHYFSNR